MKVPIRFQLKQGGVFKLFTFTLTCTRLEPVVIITRLARLELRYKDFLLSDGVVTGWDGQRMVLDDQGEPAAFSAEALAMLLSPIGVAKIIFDAYLKECRVKEKT